ncbi:TetR family transcriptional regulator [Nocardioides acrostichi]|uniref:TetR family transcriptional regulator n=1 Tax=Nocardioides acrostichi TaxID=2784339 RepID=A0A930UW48_9ACTN|nr:TetR family transcriptional regulator [Nocardioides acrostichi]MBF4161246.1 TetR family transcriptional regulator [Nocardioides acrostichi]
MRGEQTRQALRDAALALARREGVRAVTARAVAAEAGVNQALVFYHFESVEGLMQSAYDHGTRAMVAEHVADLARVRSLTDLHAVGVRLAERSRADGSAALLAQVVAAAHTEPEQARLLTASLRAWQAAIADAVRRVLDEAGLADVVDVEATTSAIAAAAIGMITLDAVPPPGPREGEPDTGQVMAGPPLGETLAAAGSLARLADRVLRLVPRAVARRVLTSLHR